MVFGTGEIAPTQFGYRFWFSVWIVLNVRECNEHALCGERWFTIGDIVL